MNLTYNDYFTTSGHGSSYEGHLVGCTQQPGSYYEESIRAAKLISENASSEIVLMFSGGIDSEYMLNIFKDAEVDFRVAILSYGVYNAHDTHFAFEYCNANGIVPEVVDVDLAQLINEDKITEIANLSKCCAYQMCSVMEGISKIDGTIIMANGESTFSKHTQGETAGNWYWTEHERINSYRNWYKEKNIDGTPDFLKYTPELTASYLLEPEVIQLVNDNSPLKRTTVDIKLDIYNKNYDIQPRQKFTGWERLERSPLFEDLVKSKFIYELKTEYNGVIYMSYDDVYHQMFKEIE